MRGWEDPRLRLCNRTTASGATWQPADGATQPALYSRESPWGPRALVDTLPPGPPIPRPSNGWAGASVLTRAIRVHGLGWVGPNRMDNLFFAYGLTPPLSIAPQRQGIVDLQLSRFISDVIGKRTAIHFLTYLFLRTPSLRFREAVSHNAHMTAWTLLK